MKTGTIQEFMDKAGPLGQCVSSALAPIAPQPPLQGHTEPYARLCPVNTVSERPLPGSRCAILRSGRRVSPQENVERRARENRLPDRLVDKKWRHRQRKEDLWLWRRQQEKLHQSVFMSNALDLPSCSL